jgi:methylmalonyl-CoA/ethylmalonyl-CoA epimerase
MIKVKKLEMVSIAVNSFEEAVPFFQNVFGAEFDEEPLVDEQFKALSFRMGESGMELLTPTNPDSLMTKHLEKRGQGLFHISLRVENFEESMQFMESQGYRVIDRKDFSAKPFKVSDGFIYQEAFMSPKDAFGVFIALVEVRKD